MSICDALRDLVPFMQFKKHEKHQWRSVTFSKVTNYRLSACNFTKINTPPRVFFSFFFKLYKWYQIAQKHHILVVRKMCLVNLLSNMEMIKTSISRD